MHIYNSLFNNLFALQLFIAKSDPLPLRRTRICLITKSGYRTGWVVRLCTAWSLQPNPPKILYPRLVKDFSCNYFRNKGLIQSIFRALVYFPCLFLGKYDRPTDRNYGQEGSKGSYTSKNHQYKMSCGHILICQRSVVLYWSNWSIILGATSSGQLWSNNHFLLAFFFLRIPWSVPKI